jgi:hypothetical protein
MVGFLDTVRERGEILAVHIPDRLGIFDTQDPPHGNGVVARAEPLPGLLNSDLAMRSPT